MSEPIWQHTSAHDLRRYVTMQLEIISMIADGELTKAADALEPLAVEIRDWADEFDRPRSPISTAPKPSNDKAPSSSPDADYYLTEMEPRRAKMAADRQKAMRAPMNAPILSSAEFKRKRQIIRSHYAAEAERLKTFRSELDKAIAQELEQIQADCEQALEMSVDAVLEAKFA